jgi:S1-C subfamily serine protease
VVRGRSRFRVTLQDKSQYHAALVGADEKSDLAVLKITTPRPLPERAVAALGDSDRVRVGQWAIAVGSPYGYDQTLTVGVISARGRTVEGPGRRGAYTDLIQTDAAINQGNSGGPLVNVDGEVVGINVLIAAAPGAAGSIGIGFAIPINAAKAVLDPLIEQGKVTRSWLGVQTSLGNGELAPELKAQYGVPDGALVEAVTPGSPAARAGIRSEDVIVRFGERPVHRFSELEQMVGLTRPRSQVPVTLVRDQRELTVPLTLSERPSEEALARLASHPAPQVPTVKEEAPGWRTKLGLTVRQPGAAAEPGVEVTAVAPGSAAAEAGLAAGDLIQKLGRAAVPDMARFRRVMATASDSAPLVVRVKFRRTGMTGIRVLRP